MDNQEFLNKVKEYALKFDEKYGVYPEHKYEGLVFYISICESMNVPVSLQEFKDNHSKIYSYLQNEVETADLKGFF